MDAARLATLPRRVQELVIDYCTVTVRVGGQAAAVFAVLFLGHLHSTLDRPAVIVPGVRREWCRALGTELAVLHRDGAPAYLSAAHSVWYDSGFRGTCWQHLLDCGPEFVRPLRNYRDESEVYAVATEHNIAASGYITRGYPRQLLERCPRGSALALGETGSYVIDIPDESGWRIAEPNPPIEPPLPASRGGFGIWTSMIW